MKKFSLNCLAVLLLSIGFTGCGTMDSAQLTSGVAKLIQAESLTDEDMTAYVQQAVAEMDKKAQIAPSTSPYTKRLTKLTQGLTQVEGKPLNFKVYMTNEINAFACPDGSVRVYSGIMDMMTDDQLLGIIGHEVGHVAMKHSLKATKNALVTSALRDGVSSLGGTAAVLSQSMLGSLGEQLANSKYSQKQENEADDYGYEFLKKNGKNPWAMALAFEKMKALEQQQGAGGDFVTKMFSDHPDTDKRIQRMTEKATKDGYKRPSK